jgi:multimeric flavodoxin WrbA
LREAKATKHITKRQAVGENMKIIAFNGSPRGINSNTNVMVSAFLEGAKKAGAMVENIFLIEKKIHHCTGCFSCWVKTPGKCVIKDDMQELSEKFHGADIVVFATPLYVDNVSGLMKKFMDRLIVSTNPRFEKDSSGECRNIPSPGNIPKIVVISNCGFPEQTHFQVLHLLFERIARNMGSEVLAEIYRGEGELLRSKIMVLWPIIYYYKRLLQKAGQEVVTNLMISSKTKTKLEKPLIPIDLYIKSANKHFNKTITKELEEQLKQEIHPEDFNIEE